MSISVLIVEDEDIFGDAFAQAVAAAPDMHVAGRAATLAGGMAMLDGPAVDVALVDLDLPDGSGIDLIQAIRRRWRHCDVMVVSVLGDTATVLRSLQAGATGYLHKNALPRNLTRQIRELHAGGSPINPMIARQVLSKFVAPVDVRVKLTEREHEILIRASKGFSYDDIARLLDISSNTVNTHVKRIYEKLQVNSKTEAVYEARKQGIIED